MRKYPVDSIVVDSDGEILVSVNGELGGPQKLVNIAKRNVSLMREVQLVEPFGSRVTASLDPLNPLGITAALMSVKPGRSRILDAPSEVKSWIANEYENFSEPDTSDSYLTLEGLD